MMTKNSMLYIAIMALSALRQTGVFLLGRTTTKRVRAIGFAVSGMLLCLPLEFKLVSNSCHAQDSQKTFSSRSLLFPSDQSVGVLRLGMLKGPSVLLDFEQSKGIAAKGNVEVAENDFVELRVGSVDDLEFLEQLSPDALQGLTITGLEIDRKALSFITRLDGLKLLQFFACDFRKDTFEDAKSLYLLQTITVISKTLDGPTFAGWTATLPKLEYLYTRPSLDALAYQKLSGHASLTTTTIDVANNQSEWPLGLLRLPALRELIVNCDDDASPRSLDAISTLSNLESISISSGTVDGDLLKKIAELGTVRKLQLYYNNLGPRFLEGLESLQSIEQLKFNPDNRNKQNLAFFKSQLATSILKLPRIKTIPQIEKPTLQIFQQIIARESIESLDIDEWDVKVPIAKLQELSSLKGLKSLKLSYVPITDDELRYLSKLEGLEELNLWNTEVNGHGLVHLSNLPKLKRMLIAMDTRRVKPDLSRLSNLSRLEHLQLFGFGFTPEHYFPIAECGSLRIISLSGGKIDDALVTKLASLPNITTVHLLESSMTDVGALALSLNQNLENVVLGGKISRAAIVEFAKLPKLSHIHIRSSELDPVDCVDLQFEFPSVGSIGFSKLAPK